VVTRVSDPRLSVVADAIEAIGWAAELPGVTHNAVRHAGGVPAIQVPWAREA
jgi:hypothetical protein